MDPTDKDSQSSKCSGLSIFSRLELFAAMLLKSEGLWHCVNGQLFLDTLKDCSTIKMKEYNPLPDDTSLYRRRLPSSCCIVIGQWTRSV